MTWAPTEDQVSAALAHAAEVQPAESCGVIVADGEYVRMANLATGPGQFSMSVREYAAVDIDRKVAAVVHSHVNLPAIASDGDRAGCENTGLPWLITAWPTETWTVIEPSGFRAPLIGRQWSWGTLDCFGLVRDAFEDFTGILLPDFPREWEFWKNGENLIADHYRDAGFRQLPSDTTPQHCDVIGMRINSPVVNHLGIFLAPDRLLHQFQNRLSVREVYGGTYQRATELHLRHEKFWTEAPPA